MKTDHVMSVLSSSTIGGTGGGFHFIGITWASLVLYNHKKELMIRLSFSLE